MSLAIRRHTWVLLLALPAVVVAAPRLQPARLTTDGRLVYAAWQHPSPPGVSCVACIVVDERGRALFSRAAGQHRANASTTKMVTALLVVRSADPSEPVTVSSGAASVGAGGLDLQPGDVFSVHDLLYALLLSSSNDAAVALAEHVSGTEASFVDRMNRFADKLGADDTHFVTAHGLDRSGHFSSAGDLATIGRRLLEVPLLAEIVATPSVAVEGPNGAASVENRNLLLESYRGAVGIKTGYTSQAGNVLVAAARRSGRTLVAVAMGSVDATADARALLDYGWARLRRTILINRGARVGAIVWPFGGATGVVASAPVRGMADPSSLTVALEPDGTTEGVEAGDAVGRLVVSSGSHTIGAVTALASDTVTVDDTPWPASLASSLLGAAARAIGRL